MSDFPLGAVLFRGLLYVVGVMLCFLLGYWLSRKDTVREDVSSARMWRTGVVGTLLMAGTYGTFLVTKPSSLVDFAVLAFVIAHGWTADDLVDHLIERLRPRKR